MKIRYYSTKKTLIGYGCGLMLLLLLHTPAIAQQMPFPQKAYTLEGVRLRSTPSTSGEILQVVPGFTDVKIPGPAKCQFLSFGADAHVCCHY